MKQDANESQPAVDYQCTPISDRMLRQSIVAHHLRLFGVVATEGLREEVGCFVHVCDRPDVDEVDAALDTCSRGRVVVAVQPSVRYCQRLGVTHSSRLHAAPAVLSVFAKHPVRDQMRPLHCFASYACERANTLVRDAAGSSVWIEYPSGDGIIIVIGTDLAGDLVRYRQGDQRAVEHRELAPVWGYAGERPNYLFSDQLEGVDPSKRHADWMMAALRDALCNFRPSLVGEILPEGVAGAIVLTGDDDQAELGTYAEQLNHLDGVPITYFLHPKTRHDSASLQRLRESYRVDLALHPDALDEPARYTQLLHEQVRWYSALVGEQPSAVRNHGYLNDGYWGHLAAWEAEGLRWSMNLPGVDGRILNGSLLPARVATPHVLTHHWSMLTMYGDGMHFALGMSDECAATRIHSGATELKASGVPGVMVANFHPQNIGQTHAMHAAMKELVRDGFVAWTVSDCINWFEARDKIPRSKDSTSARFPRA